MNEPSHYFPANSFSNADEYEKTSDDSMPDDTFRYLLGPTTRPMRDSADLQDVADWMHTETPSDGVLAYLTYLGQFIDHDFTHSVDNRNSPRTRVSFLDLDSLYGAVGEEISAGWLGWDGKFALQDVNSDFKEKDVPRDIRGHARIPDKRNDENAIILQIHVVFMKIHNIVFDKISQILRTNDASVLVPIARREVTKAYQHIVFHDFLRSLVPHSWLPRFDDLMRMTILPDLYGNGYVGSIPYEFNTAAFRFGHTMLRPSYQLSKQFTARLMDLLKRSAPLRPEHVIDWPTFLQARAGSIGCSVVTVLNGNSRILGTANSLAYLNLASSEGRHICTGQEFFEYLVDSAQLGDSGINLEPLSRRDLSQELTTASPTLLSETPLWLYFLAEAQIGSKKYSGPGSTRKRGKLGQISALLIMECLKSLCLRTPESILSGSDIWDPSKDSIVFPHLTGTQKKIQFSNLLSLTNDI